MERVMVEVRDTHILFPYREGVPLCLLILKWERGGLGVRG